MDTPLVSIIIASYNRENYLQAAIKSALDQTYPAIELIVIDDCSSFNVASCVTSLSENITLLKNEENRGLSASQNKALRIVRGQYVGMLNDDDLYAPTKIEKQIQLFQKNPQLDIVYTDFCFINEEGAKYPTSRGRQQKLNTKRSMPNTLHALLMGNFIDAISPLVKRSCYKEAGEFDESLRNLEDWDIWLRMAAHGFKFHFLNEQLVSIRKHSHNKSSIPSKDRRARIKVLAKAFNNIHGADKQQLRKKAFATVFLDYANAVYKMENYHSYAKYMSWALKLDPSGRTGKIMRRIIKSCLFSRLSA
ncbi:MAG: glycosyltransferase [Chitinivibrionales bacterium]|nr:glycosyltransferase [Chitinivibrionales bacterium]